MTGKLARGRARVLAILGNIALNGQERGNIEVFLTAKRRGAETLVVTHDVWGHHHIQPLLDKLGVAWTTVDYARHFTHQLSWRGWLVNIGRLLRASWRFWGIIRRYQPTHIHVANPHYYLSVLPALYLTRAPVIYRLGDEPTLHHTLHRLLWRWFIVPRVRTFVCVSNHIRLKAVEAGVNPTRTRVIYSFPPERPNDEQATFEIEPFEGLTVTYVGQIAAHKGVDLLVDTAIALCEIYRDVRFLIAGQLSRRNSLALRLYAKVQALGLADRIRFLGYVDDVSGLLAEADLHVCPSVGADAMSNTVVEAKQAGTASVVFPSGGLPELITHGKDGWVCEARTAESLQTALVQLLALPTAGIQTMGVAARASMEELGITEAVFAEAWLDIYDVPDPPRTDLATA